MMVQFDKIVSKMILEKSVIRTYKGGKTETLKIEELSLKSGLVVTRICDECNKIEKRKYYRVIEGMVFCKGKQLCKKCSHNTEARKEISSKAGKRTYKLHPEQYKGFPLEACSKGGKAGTAVLKATGVYIRTGKKISKSLKEKYKLGLLTSKPPYGKRHYYKEYCFRSTWELKFAEYLDSKKINWVYEQETFPLVVNNSYLPDFYLVDKDLYVEVKGYWREDAFLKFNEFKQLFPNKNILVVDNLNFDNFNLS